MLSVISPPGSPLVFRFQLLDFKRSLSKKRMPHYSFLPTSLAHTLSTFCGDMKEIAASACLKTVPEPEELLFFIHCVLVLC